MCRKIYENDELVETVQNDLTIFRQPIDLKTALMYMDCVKHLLNSLDSLDENSFFTGQPE